MTKSIARDEFMRLLDEIRVHLPKEKVEDACKQFYQDINKGKEN